MKVVSTNIAEPKFITWKNKQQQTGIFKTPVSGISVTENGVEDDVVSDKKHHGGLNMACYLYSFDHYDYWKELYPNLDWSHGMFGENITMANFDEKVINIGDQISNGSVIMQVTQPRNPCFKLGIKFSDQNIIKQFYKLPFCGAYLKVIQAGFVKPNDDFTVTHKEKNSLSLAEIFSLNTEYQNQKELLKKAIQIKGLSEDYKKDFLKLLNRIS